jgi:putative transposase
VKPELVANGPNQVWSWDIERREALFNRTGVRDHRRRAIAVAR